MRLCETVDAFSGSGQVAPGGSADFAIWLSASGANIDGVTVSLTTTPTSAKAHFTVCPSGHTDKCTITTLSDTGFVELLATVAVPTSSTNGEQITLNAKTTATKPALTVTASGSVKVAVPSPATATTASGRTHLPGHSATAASSGSSQSALSLSNGSLPLVTGGQVFAKRNGNIGSLLPSIPAVTPSPQAGQAVAGTRGGTEQVASAGPLDRRLVGTQLIALAALCAAVGIVIAKLTLRTPRPAVSAAKAGAPGSGRVQAGENASGSATNAPVETAPATSGQSASAAGESAAGAASAPAGAADAPGATPRPADADTPAATPRPADTDTPG